jgi:sulfur-oxidizing protein SoxX
MRLGIALLASIALVQGCAQSAPDSPTGFALPAGDATAGRQAFIDLRCHVCHPLKGIDIKYEGTGAVSVVLGGEVTRVRTYGELVTSIINPSHKIAPGYPLKEVAPGGKSLMEVASLNDVMTIRQLIDLVAFLQPQYKVLPPPNNPYAYRYIH